MAHPRQLALRLGIAPHKFVSTDTNNRAFFIVCGAGGGDQRPWGMSVDHLASWCLLFFGEPRNIVSNLYYHE